MAARVAGMTHTTKAPPNRRAAADAARKLLAPGIQQKVDLVSALADAALAALAAEDAYQAAEQHLQACRTAYAERYRAAVSGGWSDAELTQLDLPVEALEQGPRRPPRRRTPAKTVADQPPAPAETARRRPTTAPRTGKPIRLMPTPALPTPAPSPRSRRPGRRLRGRRCRCCHDRRRAPSWRHSGPLGAVGGRLGAARWTGLRSIPRADRSARHGFVSCPAGRSAAPWTAGWT